MQLHCYKTLWGHTGSFADACELARDAGFYGVEGPAPAAGKDQVEWRQQLTDNELHYIAEICTAGSYVPDRSATVTEHLSSLEQKLHCAAPLCPQLVNCLGGCDAWEEGQSMDFFSEAMLLAKKFNITISFETHRGRSFFNPWITAKICKQLPELKLTADFSHWCVVCERLMDMEYEVLNGLIDRVLHIHARVGYEQGPQVADPRLVRYQPALASHQQWWRRIWTCQQQQGLAATTLTPEFGPDGYQQVDAVTDMAVADLWEINRWMAQSQRQQFDQWLTAEKITGGTL